tara:strand:+ start:15174 stop:16754 length:1581 start_codon:yes stop_codon:yes gene_type:complete
MFIDDHHYDCIIIGSGAGGATLASELSRQGKWVLLLERGVQLPLEDQNIKDVDLFKKNRYHPPNEKWFGTDGDPFSPQTTYALGGNTKIWGAVLQRMREKDFKSLNLQEGVSPAWPFEYDELEEYYNKAEDLFKVHGRESCLDITEPPHSKNYSFGPRRIEPFLESIRKALERHGCRPYDLPLSWSAPTGNENSPYPSCSFFPRGDAQLFGLYSADRRHLELRTNAKVIRLHVNPSGKLIKGVEVDINGDQWLFSADIVVLAAGVINTPLILLRSKTTMHPNGLGNGSDQVGRNLMNLQMTCILQRASKRSDGSFGKSLGVNDYYWGDENVNFPLGHIQSGGGVLQDVLFAESPPVLSLIAKLIPDFGLRRLASRSISWWAMTEVLPDPENRVYLNGEQIRINYLHNNLEAHDRLVYRWLNTLNSIEKDPLTKVVSKTPTHPRGSAPLSVVGYACGTCRMGTDPAKSVVDLNGKCHEIDNLYISDASIFPSCPSIGNGLTVIALALRLAKKLSSDPILRPLICRTN